MITHTEKVVILDFGSQYTQLIARRIRAHAVFSEIVPFSIRKKQLTDTHIKGIILSGGPFSVYEKHAPLIDPGIFDLNTPLLGICYGHQLIAHLMGGTVDASPLREYGYAELVVNKKTPLLGGIPHTTQVWMSHGDKILSPPPGFLPVAHTDNTQYAIVKHRSRPIWGFQFHPEVTHTAMGDRMLHNFLFQVCKCKGDWDMKSFIEITKKEVQKRVGKGKVILGLSGGVDSSVTAMLLQQALGDRLFVVFINNGLLRKDEHREVRGSFLPLFGERFIYVNAENQFLKALRAVTDPEIKRKIIGKTFIKVFEKEAKRNKDINFLAQGTLYPDRIESKPVRGPSSTIKSHHNVGGLPEKMDLELIEPLKELFKDEVRSVGAILGLPGQLLQRHPFPGPGLAVRIVGNVTRKRLAMLRDADSIFIDEIKRRGLYRKIWQAFCILLPVKTVGVMGDKRTYDHVIALRAVTSKDGMTADWFPFSKGFLTTVCNRIINEVQGVNRVVYDVSSKPPATIEWE
jgi:GMP synthase (glutamine-hydrolysing)